MSQRRLLTHVFAAATMAALAVVVSAQQTGQSSQQSSSQQTQAQQQPVFRARTDLVSVFVVAVDDQNQPVRGLTKDDFTVTDRKKPQQI